MGIPRLLRRVRSGVAYATVVLTDAKTGRRREHSLGRYDDPDSRVRYARLLAEWEGANRSLPYQHKPGGLTVALLVHGYFRHRKDSLSRKQQSATKLAARLLLDHHRDELASAFGPNALRSMRAKLLEQGLSRASVLERIRLIVAMFRWGVSHELVPADVLVALRTLEPLRGGRRRRVLPVPEAFIDVVRSRVSPAVATMIDLQLLTGARPGELCQMRPCDLDMTGDVWLYRPQRHKSEHHGRDRVIYLGPRAVELVRPYLDRPTDAPLFSPAESERDRGAGRVGPRCPGERYSPNTYRQAIVRACKSAGVTPWHPHQLRHNAATEIRRRYGLEAAAVLLGHASAALTDAVYAERDQQAALRIVREIG